MATQGEHLLVTHMDNARVLSAILKTAQFREVASSSHSHVTSLPLFTQTATCFISSTGLRVTVEQAKCVQANCFIQSDIFQQYSYSKDSPCVFCIDLNALIVST